MRTVYFVRTHSANSSVQYQCKYQQQFLEFSDKIAILYCLQIETPRTWENDTPESDL